ncbi:putative membrane protein [Peptoniphilus sp. ING2-D1G]|nr:putative membrane protein [Peptoniphilus sp. ING2-D1G]
MNSINFNSTGLSGAIPDFILVLGSFLFISLLFLLIYYLINIGNRYIDRQKRINFNLIVIIRIFLALVLLYIVKNIFNKFPVLTDTFWAIISAVIVSFMINPIVTFLEEKNIPRRIGVILVYVTALFVFTVFLLTVVPKTTMELSNLITKLQEVFEVLGNELIKVNHFINEMFSYELFYNFNTEEIVKSIQNSITDFIIGLQSDVLMSLRGVASGVGNFFSKLVRIVLIFIFTFYFTVDKDKFKNSIIRNIPHKYKDDILYVSSRINRAMLDFVKGRMLMAIIVGFLTMLYLLILNVDFAIVIGLITCIADIIPYIGPFLGFLPAVLFAFIESPMKAVWVGILFVLLQWAENNIIAPKLLSDKTGLNPLLILISIIVGGATMGVFGMIFAVPIASVIIILIDFAKIKYNQKNRNIV